MVPPTMIVPSEISLTSVQRLYVPFSLELWIAITIVEYHFSFAKDFVIGSHTWSSLISLSEMLTNHTKVSQDFY